MDTSNRPTWRRPAPLLLGLMVLLAHLGLLQSMPLGLNPASPRSDAAMRFVTRSITPLPQPEPVMPTLAAPQRRTAATRPATPAPQEAPSPPGLTGDQNGAPHAPGPGATGAETATVALADAVGDPGDPGDTAETAVSPGASPPPDAESSVESAAAMPADPPASAPEVAAPEVMALAAPSAEALRLRHPRNQAARFKVASLTGSTRLNYEVRSNKLPITLKGELLWQNLGDHYEARLGYSAFGLSRSQTSQGQITTEGLVPERFADKYRNEVAAHFNYPQGKVSFSANTPDAPLLTGAQDRLSVLLQLGALVAGEPGRFTPGTLVTLQTVGPREADVWLFTFEESETLALPGGSVQAIKLVRNPRKPYDQKVEVWLAPQLGYLPARIRITDTNGDSVDQQWLASAALTNPP
ncbi:DUF3108 domain-containing protein [Rhodoferax sp.]|uniref:DUF3108 domain-containing protein n=1 Tax=Rhodoferax sp. TaxID=50421 RepID=UPI0025E6F483|nr:DUF3108 domain-containing protein [Rhodoferax sp.]